MKRLFCLSMLVLSACNSADPDKLTNPAFTEVYISSGKLQCFSDSGQTPEQTAQRLTNAGIDVEASSCGAINGIAVAAACGLGDASINTHIIRTQNVADARALGFETVASLQEGYTDNCTDTPSSSTTVTVYDTQLVRGCSEPNNRSLDESVQVLANAGVSVDVSSCAFITGVAFIERCFAPTGEIYIHEIPSSDVNKANAEGFESVQALGSFTTNEGDVAGQVGFIGHDCTLIQL